MYKYLNEKFINTTFKTKIELYILTLLMFYLFYFFYTKIDFFENKASVENSFNMENLNKKYEGTTLLLLNDIVLAPETFVQLAGVNPYSQPKSIRTLSRRSFVQNGL